MDGCEHRNDHLEMSVHLQSHSISHDRIMILVVYVTTTVFITQSLHGLHASTIEHLSSGLFFTG